MYRERERERKRKRRNMSGSLCSLDSSPFQPCPPETYPGAYTGTRITHEKLRPARVAQRTGDIGSLAKSTAKEAA